MVRNVILTINFFSSEISVYWGKMQAPTKKPISGWLLIDGRKYVAEE